MKTFSDRYSHLMKTANQVNQDILLYQPLKTFQNMKCYLSLWSMADFIFQVLIVGCSPVQWKHALITDIHVLTNSCNFNCCIKKKTFSQARLELMTSSNKCKNSSMRPQCLLDKEANSQLYNYTVIILPQ